MDSNMTNELCPLCLAFNLGFLINSEVTNKIEKYLQMKMEYSWTAICLNCYNSIEEFHKFYERVHMAQKNFHKKFFLHSQKVTSEVEPKQPETFKTDNRKESDEKVFQAKVTETEIDDVQPKQTLDEKGVNVPNQVEDTCAVEKVNEDIRGLGDNELVKVKTKTYKKMKHSDLKKVSSEIEKKMLEFYNIKCEKCEGGKFTSFKMLNKHYMTVHNTQGYIKCCKRNIRVNDKYYLRIHMFKHLHPDTCRCRVCGKELSSIATLKHHMILHKPTEERPFQCLECDKRFCCKNDLKNHEKAIHLPENEREDYICDVCGKVFQKVANLRYHHSTVHLQERKYICEICAKCFTTQRGLRTHIDAAHSTLDPIQCSECNKWLKTKETFQKHLQLHQNNTYPCTHCDKVCNSYASLRSHLVKHSEERPYSCTVCRKSFKTKTHLKNHSIQHLGGKHYKCPYCSKLFVNMSNYYTHRRRMHSTERKNKQEDRTEVRRNQNLEQANVNQGNDFVYDYKIVKNSLENFNNSLVQEQMSVR